MAQAKICGINSPDAFDAAVTGGAAFVGFVFFPASPRSVSPEQAAALIASGPTSGGPLRVGLFVEPEEAAIAQALAVAPLDILQLYTAAPRAAALRARLGLPVWRALGLAQPADLPAHAEGAAGLRREAQPPPAATRPGGNAHRFDWALLRGWRAPCPWVLAGGLDPTNVAAAIAATGARIVDVSSGVERARGQKDPALIRAFIAQAG
jgi:phosphoribosylanthranilate isomerase